jgi:CrcB protein
MSRFLLVCVGGAIGTGIRYVVAITGPRLWGTAFPYGTLAVNIVGSFLLGAIMHVGFATNLISPTMKVVLASGIMGGLTTYSTFNYETLEYVSQGAFGLAGLNLVVTVTLCLLAGALGVTSARFLVGS